jgi:hypothetical protein
MLQHLQQFGDKSRGTIIVAAIVFLVFVTSEPTQTHHCLDPDRRFLVPDPLDETLTNQVVELIIDRI